MITDYRESHVAPEKGASYHAAFSRNPYRRMVWEFEKSILDHALRTFLGNTEIDHLDFACGTGRILGHCESRTRISVGVDVSPSMLAVARETARSAELIQGDLTREDLLGDRRFNLITAFRFFPNAQPDLRLDAMRALLKHLRSDGYLIFNNHKNTASIRNRIARGLGRRGFHGMSIDETKELLRANHLEILKTYHLSVLPVSENRTFLPLAMLRSLEALLSKCPSLRSLGGNLLYVCRRSADDKE